MKRELVLHCDCKTPDHIVVINDYQSHDYRLVIWTQLNHYLPWWKRLWFGLKYIFGRSSDWPHWEETLVQLEAIPGIINFLRRIEKEESPEIKKAKEEQGQQFLSDRKKIREYDKLMEKEKDNE